jgi:hypothetical protein
MKFSSNKVSSNRSFGLLFFIVFLIISLFPLKNGENILLWALTLSIIFLILGLLNSKLLKPLNTLWFKLGATLGSIASPIVMGVIFFFVVTPTGIIMRLLGKDILKLKMYKNVESYWIKKNEEKTTMKNQF